MIDGQSKIANKAVEQDVRHLTQSYQDDWESLLTTAVFLYNYTNHTSIIVCPYKENHVYNLTCGRIPLSEKCKSELTVKTRLKHIKEVL